MDMAVEHDVLETARTDGLQEGKTEKAKAIARNMLAKGLDIALIVETTGLSEEELMAASKSIE
ncbi:hypothetical protein PN36_25410 [Candidatus Thiomargarita nelsonii]|uniref:Transposase n=1 Tax=Candidatus Thiomargarita nelsonii TaxID=1003181 RepID=A0A4E0RPT0_9GAMM|nr:hypothetical protein PN36_25410 [Candidatus Thiomargarita nelsonii]